MPEMDAFPSVLTARDQWVCWREMERGGKPTKVPVNPHNGNFASATNPDSWGSFEEARAYLDGGSADGLGFVFTADDPVVGVDLDDCRVPETGTTLDWAAAVIETLDSYTERSPSGTGFHVLLRGAVPGDRSRRGDVEVYDDARFFTMTGDHVDGTPTTVESRQAALDAVYADHVAADDAGEAAAASDDAAGGASADHVAVGEPGTTEGGGASSGGGRDGSAADGRSDAALLEKARNARNGDAFTRLWRGSTAGYDSHSEADMALCCHLAFWTGGDPARVDALFRDSGLMRAKWDEPHYADGRTYGEVTVQRAVERVDETYEPSQGQPGERSASPSTPPSEMDSSMDTPTAADATSSVSATTQPSDVDTLYERIEDLSAAVNRLEAENERLRAELEAARETDTATDSTADSDERGILPWLRSLVARHES